MHTTVCHRILKILNIWQWLHQFSLKLCQNVMPQNAYTSKVIVFLNGIIVLIHYKWGLLPILLYAWNIKHGITRFIWNKALWLFKSSHMPFNIQSECFIVTRLWLSHGSSGTVAFDVSHLVYYPVSKANSFVSRCWLWLERERYGWRQTKLPPASILINSICHSPRDNFSWNFHFETSRYITSSLM